MMNCKPLIWCQLLCFVIIAMIGLIIGLVDKTLSNVAKILLFISLGCCISSFITLNISDRQDNKNKTTINDPLNNQNMV